MSNLMCAEKVDLGPGLVGPRGQPWKIEAGAGNFGPSFQGALISSTQEIMIYLQPLGLATINFVPTRVYLSLVTFNEIN